ncbi:MAG: putative immunity protein [Smithella sp.]|jgi:hypothetical protein
MKTTLKWLKKHDACREAVAEWKKQGRESDPVKVINLAMAMDRFDWANWLIVRVMEYNQYVAYAIFAAEQVIEIHEKRFPDDKRPREAIEAARECLKNPTKENKAAAYAAAYAAAAAASAAPNAAYAAAFAASAAPNASKAAAYAASAAPNASKAAASAAFAASNAKQEMRQRIITYGIKLLEGNHEHS